MAIAFDAATTSTTGSWSHTCTGSNRILLLFSFNNGGSYITSPTYNGVAFTEITYTTYNGSISMWYLINPTVGTNTIVCSGVTANSCLFAASYTGVKQTSQPDSFNSGAGTSLTISTTVVNSGCWLVSMGDDGLSATGFTSGLATSRSTGTYNSGTIWCGISDSNGTVGTGSQTATYTSGAGDNGILISLAPAPSLNNGDFFAFF